MLPSFSLRKQILIAGILLSFVPLMVTMAIIAKKEQKMVEIAVEECGILAYDDLDHIANSVRALCKSHGDLTAEEGYQKLRTAIMDIQVGKTGYVFILDSQGNYVISKGGARDGDNIYGAKDANGVSFIQEIVAKAQKLKPGQIDEQFYPWKNKGESEARMKLARIAYYEPWDWVIGASSYEEDFYQAKRSIAGLGHQNLILMAIMVGVTLLLSGIFWSLLSGKITRQISNVADTLKRASEQVTYASKEVSDSGQQLAEGASEQASALEEVAASLQEIDSSTQKSVEHAQETDVAAKGASSAAQNGLHAMERMSTAINDIKQSSDETARILKTIDEIAFQTNLLALNAAVEAARAGDAGKGFAVVAEEVRNLAQRSADAARSTASLIADSLTNADNGVSSAHEVGEFLEEIAGNIENMTGLVSQMHETSTEQASGLKQITIAVDSLNGVTQTNAATAEESASASVELNSQAKVVFKAVDSLKQVIEGGTAVAYAVEPSSVPRPVRARPVAASVATPPMNVDEVLPLDADDLIEI